MGKTRDISDFLGDVNTDITSGQFISDITTGTSPLVVSSTTVVSNLNSDTLDGISSGSFVRSDQDDNVTGNITFDAGVIEKASQLTGTTPTIDCDLANCFYLTTSGNTTISFSNPPASGNIFVLELEISSGGTYTITFPASVLWEGGTAPDVPASGATGLYVLRTRDAGTTWLGFQIGAALS